MRWSYVFPQQNATNVGGCVTLKTSCFLLRSFTCGFAMVVAETTLGFSYPQLSLQFSLTSCCFSFSLM